MPSRWLTLGEASTLLGIAPGTLRRWADAGLVPTFRTPGRHRRFTTAGIRLQLQRTARRAAMEAAREGAQRVVLAALAERAAAVYGDHARDDGLTLGEATQEFLRLRTDLAALGLSAETDAFVDAMLVAMVGAYRREAVLSPARTA